jgi:hypothetical protein
MTQGITGRDIKNSNGKFVRSDEKRWKNVQGQEPTSEDPIIVIISLIILIILKEIIIVTLNGKRQGKINEYKHKKQYHFY